MTYETAVRLERRQDLNATLALVGRITLQDQVAMRDLLEQVDKENQLQEDWANEV